VSGLEWFGVKIPFFTLVLGIKLNGGHNHLLVKFPQLTSALEGTLSRMLTTQTSF